MSGFHTSMMRLGVTLNKKLPLEQHRFADGTTRLLSHGAQGSTRVSTSFPRIGLVRLHPLALHNHQPADICMELSSNLEGLAT